MKALKFKFDLDNKVAVYVPSTVGVDKICDTRKQVDETLTKLSGWFGGATNSAKRRWRLNTTVK